MGVALTRWETQWGVSGMAATHDLDLVRAALGGDVRAFHRLFDACFEMTARFVSTRETARTEVQGQIRRGMREIFVRLPEYRGETPLFVFAFAILTASPATPSAAPAERLPASGSPASASSGSYRRQRASGPT